MAQELQRVVVAKPWGREDLPSPFNSLSTERVGEIWFDPPEEYDKVLVKYLFTSEKLSVQVHPNDDQAPSNSSGKAECWYILSANEDSAVALGLKSEIDAAALRAAAEDGSIESLLVWHSVQEGDLITIPPGTIHAIGGGLTILEVQQNSDVTYRLYDYGRPRELHLDQALRVADRSKFDTSLILRRDDRVRTGDPQTLVRHEKFDVSLGGGKTPVPSAHLRRALFVILKGSISANGENFHEGSCILSDNPSDLSFSTDSVWVAITAK